MNIKRYINILTADTNKGVIVGVIIVFIILSLMYPNFSTFQNLEVITMNFIQEAIMALGMTIVIIAGGIDLSVGSVMAFTAIVVTLLLKAEISIVVSILLTLMIAALIGFWNAFLINRLDVHPFIVTLATMTIFRGGAFVLTQGGSVGGAPIKFSYLGQGKLFGLQFPIVLFIMLAIIFGILLKKQKYLNHIYLLGSNPQAARLCGVSINKLRITTYITSSVLAGIAGIITASQYLSCNSGFGLTAELKVITAVIIGGVSLSGGKGSIGGTVWGIIFITLINSVFIQVGLPTYWKSISYGSMLLIAVLIEKNIYREEKLGEKSWADFLLSGGTN